MDIRMYILESYTAKGYKAIRIYGKAMKIYNSMATIIAIRLHSYMAKGLMAIWQ